MKIDINNTDWYLHSKPEIKERTKNRLQEIIDLGLEEVGNASFGIPNLMGGLYIERVWSFNDAEWESYIKWIKKLKNGKNN